NGCIATTPVTMEVKRGSRVLILSMYPRYDASLKHARLGIIVGQATRSVGPVDAAGRSVSAMWYVTHVTVTKFVELFQPQARKQLHSAVGAFKVTQQEFAYDTTSAFETLA